MSELGKQADALAKGESTTALIRLALAEDVGSGDVTTTTMVPEDARAEARILARQTGVACGFPIVARLIAVAGLDLELLDEVEEGSRIEDGQVIARFRGSARALLTLERTALNFLQRMGGVATMTSRYVERVAGTKAKILETRKTIPGWRLLDKYAVRAGGGDNHRLGLFDMILAKENHFVLCPGKGYGERVRYMMTHRPDGIVAEVEAENLTEFEAALEAGVEMILLDNMSLEDLRRAVETRDASGKSTLLEASGGITLETVRGVAETGVDRISVGALTHSVKALDISLLVDL